MPASFGTPGVGPEGASAVLVSMLCDEIAGERTRRFDVVTLSNS